MIIKRDVDLSCTPAAAGISTSSQKGSSFTELRIADEGNGAGCGDHSNQGALGLAGSVAEGKSGTAVGAGSGAGSLTHRIREDACIRENWIRPLSSKNLIANNVPASA